MKLCSTLHLLSVFPIVCYVIRVMVFGTIYKNAYPSRPHVIGYALTILTVCLIVLYNFYNSLGSLLGIVGATFGFIILYFVPIVMNLVYFRRRHPPKQIMTELESREAEELHKNHEENHHTINEDKQNFKETLLKVAVKEKLKQDFEKKYTFNPELDLKDKFIYSEYSESIYYQYAFYGCQGLMLLVGFMTMVFQFIPVNIFGVEIINKPIPN